MCSWFSCYSGCSVSHLGPLVRTSEAAYGWRTQMSVLQFHQIIIMDNYFSVVLVFSFSNFTEYGISFLLYVLVQLGLIYVNKMPRGSLSLNIDIQYMMQRFFLKNYDMLFFSFQPFLNFFKFALRYSWLTMLWGYQMNSKKTQSYVCI